MGATQSLKKAIDESNFKKCIESVILGADLTMCDKSGMNIIEYARSKKLNMIATYLLLALHLQKAGNDPTQLNAIGEDGFTILTFAARYNVQHLAEDVISRGGSVNATDKSGYTALLYACEYNHSDMIEFLLKYNADPNSLNKWSQSCVSFLASQRNLHGIKLLLQAKADPNTASNTGATPLMRAAIDGDVSVVQQLLASRANPHAYNGLGESALFHAAEGGHREVLDLLVRSRAHCDLANKQGYTPLIRAAARGHVMVAELLLQNGANPNVAALDGNTALLIAADSKNNGKEMCKVLIQHKADVNYVSPHGETPFLRAISQTDLSLAQMLIDNGASAEIGSARGATPLELLTTLSITVDRSNSRMQRPSVSAGASGEVQNILYIPANTRPPTPQPAVQPQMAPVFDASLAGRINSASFGDSGDSFAPADVPTAYAPPPRANSDASPYSNTGTGTGMGMGTGETPGYSSAKGGFSVRGSAFGVPSENQFNIPSLSSQISALTIRNKESQPSPSLDSIFSQSLSASSSRSPTPLHAPTPTPSSPSPLPTGPASGAAVPPVPARRRPVPIPGAASSPASPSPHPPAPAQTGMGSVGASAPAGGVRMPGIPLGGVAMPMMSRGASAPPPLHDEAPPPPPPEDDFPPPPSSTYTHPVSAPVPAPAPVPVPASGPAPVPAGVAFGVSAPRLPGPTHTGASSFYNQPQPVFPTAKSTATATAPAPAPAPAAFHATAPVSGPGMPPVGMQRMASVPAPAPAPAPAPLAFHRQASVTSSAPPKPTVALPPLPPTPTPAAPIASAPVPVRVAAVPVAKPMSAPIPAPTPAPAAPAAASTSPVSGYPPNMGIGAGPDGAFTGKTVMEVGLDPQDMCINWRATLDASSNEWYYYNSVTKVTSWTIPPCIGLHPPMCTACGCDCFEPNMKRPSKCMRCGHHHVTGNMNRR